MTSRRRYTYAEAAARIEEELGVRPSLSTLRAASAAAARGTNSRIRITAGMPAPVGRDEAGRAVFDAARFDRWLAAHPRRRMAIVQQRLAAGRPSRRAAAVAKARAAGLSWQQIADTLGAADGTTYTRQQVWVRYR